MSPRRPCPPRVDPATQALIDQARRACPPGERSVFDLTVGLNSPHAAHQRAGAAAHDAGDAWEAWCEAEHTAALTLGLAEMKHYDAAGVVAMEHGRPMRDRRGRILKAQTGKSPTDYVGHTLSGPPRAVYVEAKWRGDKRLHRERERGNDLDADRQGIAKHQRELLASAARGGHIALVVVGYERAKGTCHYAVPWLELEKLWTVSGAVRSVGPTELAGWEVATGCYLLRWIGGAR